jgi:transposase-like protein
MKIWCPGCMEKIDRKSIIKHQFKCPRCGYNFRRGDEYTTDDFDDLMMMDFAADGDLDGLV